MHAHLENGDPGAAAGAAKGKAKKAAKTGKQAGGAPSIGDSFTSLASEPGGTTDIESNELVVYEAKGQATFRGDVIAVRGAHEIRAALLEVAFRNGGAAAKPGAAASTTGDISRIKATGRVVVKAPDQQVSTSDWLIYDAAAETITIGGNVVLTQGKNVIKGEKLVVDLKTGQSHFELGETAEVAGKKRVRMLINQGEKLLQGATAGGGATTQQGAGQ